MKVLRAIFAMPGFWGRNTFSPAKLRNRARLTSDYLRGETTVGGRPVVLQLEVTNRCTMKCAMCPRNSMTRPQADMDEKLFCRIIDENRDNAEIAILHLMGEPLLHPKLPEMIRYCRDAGIRTVISTNASVLEPQLDERLLKSGLDVIVFSLDGFDSDTFSKLRRGGDFGKILGNINRFLSAKERKDPQAIIQMIDMPETRGQVRPFVEYWNGRPGSIVAIKPFTSWQGDIDEIKKKGWNVDLQALEHSRCDRLWMWLTVFADGRLATCCRDYDATVKVGDLTRQGCMEAWNGAEMKAFRESHLKGRSSVRICRSCDYNPIICRSLSARIAFRMFDQHTLYRLLYLLERQTF